MACWKNISLKLSCSEKSSTLHEPFLQCIRGQYQALFATLSEAIYLDEMQNIFSQKFFCSNLALMIDVASCYFSMSLFTMIIKILSLFLTSTRAENLKLSLIW